MKTFISLNAPYRPAPSYTEEPTAYQYQYPAVDDAKDNFAQNEVRDSYATNRVALPTGNNHINHTNNAANAHSGYLAEVRNDGESKYEFYMPAPVSSMRTPSKDAPYQRTPYRRAPYKRTPYNRAPHSV